MDKAKKVNLEAAGWTLGSAQDFLQLNDAESAFVDLKLMLGEALRERRTAQKMSQAELAKRLHSSQSRVAKMEHADPTVTLDLILRSLLALGTTRQELAKTLMGVPLRPAQV
jgi:predicted XRE-type DNA-binding protein